MKNDLIKCAILTACVIIVGTLCMIGAIKLLSYLDLKHNVSGLITKTKEIST